MRTETRGTSVVETNSGNPDQGGRAAIPVVFLSRSQMLLRYLLFSVLAAGGASWDLWSKWYVFDWLKCPGIHHVWSGSLVGISIKFDLATTFNHGALWGIGQNQTWLFASLSFVAIGVIGFFLWTRQAIQSWWLTVAAGLLFAGTIGNLYDRMGWHQWRDDNGTVYAVRDFLDFIFCDGAFHWATFNFADMFLVTGAIMLVVQSIWSPAGDVSTRVEIAANPAGGNS